MTPSIIITPAAEGDLMEAIVWYESGRPGLSLDFRLSLDATLDRLVRYPDSCEKVSPTIRRALLPRFPMPSITGRKTGVIEVIAIMDPHRHPRHWQERSR